MPELHHTNNSFLDRITATVEENLSNEQFGVSELADAANMSRSNLLRKVKKLTGLSVSQLIRQVRLKQGMKLLRDTSQNVSEVSHQVGFGSTSYFIKCFREYYGYPPGEVGKRDEAEEESIPVAQPVPRQKAGVKAWMLIVAGAGILLAIGLISYLMLPSFESPPLEKSIAVLPFKNDSNDSSNVYLINGLMEATLNNLQKIEDLKVISRTSVEKYRSTSKSIPEMARELNVNYFVEGSGQKIGDQILLNIQLIEAPTDRHLWGSQYQREVQDIFTLQQEVAKNIALEIQAVITPEERKRIEKIPTDNLVAYDLFLKGQNIAYYGSHEKREEAIAYFKQAIEHDPNFALAYANIAFTYYYQDVFKAEKKYTAEIGNYADRALLLDAELEESLIAKALYYINRKEAELALSYFEKALEYNPNSMLVINLLTDFYTDHYPNTSKYLEYALKGFKLDVAANDSITTSYNYLRLSNALLQTGFFDEALKYVDKSLEYNPENPYAYLKTYVLFAQDKNIKRTKDLLIRELQKDTTRVDIMQEVGKTYYTLREYDSAYYYYQRFLVLKQQQNLDVYRHENLKLAIVWAKLGYEEEAEVFAENYKDYAEHDRSLYQNLHLASYQAYKGNAQKAVEYLKLFLKEGDYQYWVLLMEHDPVVDSIKGNPEFQKVMEAIKTKFWNAHDEIEVTLKEKGLL